MFRLAESLHLHFASKAADVSGLIAHENFPLGNSFFFVFYPVSEVK